MTKQHAEPITTTSANINEERLAQLRQLFPEAFTEGKVDFSKLRATLGDLVDDRPERYSFTWAGKQNAIRILQTPTNATLIPAPQESVDFNNTQNIFIEGDNLEVLKLLYKSYFGRVKMIYIDPPYNTGNDFIYPDNYADPLNVYLQLTRQQDTEGNLLFTNNDVSGRYHSRWLNLIYPRLFLARQLLTNDGILLVSIDDREMANLRLLLNEVFGEENFLTTFVWVNEGNIDNQSKVKRNHEYIVAYAKDEKFFGHPPAIDPNIPETSKLYRQHIENTIVKNGPKNPVSSIELPIGFPANFEAGVIEPNNSEGFWPKLGNRVEVENYKTKNVVTVSSGWSSKQIFERFIESNFKPVTDTKDQETTFYFTESGAIFNRKERPEGQSHVLTVLRGMGSVQGEASKLLDLGIDFDYPKPTELLKYLVQVGGDSNCIVMDFFAGSCPLAEAVLTLNREDNGRRKFVVVQLPEPIPEKSSARRQGFKHISDVGRERIYRIILQMKAKDEGKLPIGNREMPEDLGFKVFKLAPSNFRAWEGAAKATPEEFASQMELFTDPLVNGWRPANVIYEIALKEGYSLNCYIRRTAVAGHEVYRINDQEKEQHFYLCLENAITENLPAKLALEPDALFVCRDIALDDTMAANLALQCRLKTI